MVSRLFCTRGGFKGPSGIYSTLPPLSLTVSSQVSRAPTLFYGLTCVTLFQLPRALNEHSAHIFLAKFSRLLPRMPVKHGKQTIMMLPIEAVIHHVLSKTRVRGMKIIKAWQFLDLTFFVTATAKLQFYFCMPNIGRIILRLTLSS